MEKKIKLSVKPLYGRELFYPGCELSDMICALLNQKTLTAGQIKTLQKYGYDVQCFYKTMIEATAEYQIK